MLNHPSKTLSILKASSAVYKQLHNILDMTRERFTCNVVMMQHYNAVIVLFNAYFDLLLD